MYVVQVKGGYVMRFPYKAYSDMMKAEKESMDSIQRDVDGSAADKKKAIDESAIDNDDDEFANVDSDESEEDSVD